MEKPQVPLRGGSSIRLRPRKRETERRRSNEFWIAVIGVLSTLIVGVTGSVVTYKVSEANNRTQLQLAQDTFNRNQQVEDYRAYSKAYRELFQAAIDASGTITYRESTESDIRDKVNMMHEKYNAYLTAVTTLEFSADRDVYGTALATADDALALHQVFDPWDSDPHSPVPSLPGAAEQFRSEVLDKAQTLINVHDKVIESMRRDLGLTD